MQMIYIVFCVWIITWIIKLSLAWTIWCDLILLNVLRPLLRAHSWLNWVEGLFGVTAIIVLK